MGNPKNSAPGCCRRAVSIGATVEKALKRRNCGYLVVALLCISMAIMATSSPARAQFKLKACITPDTLMASATSGIRVGAIADGQLNFQQALNVMIIVSNRGADPAKNVHLYCRANPGGFFMVDVIDQPVVLRDEDNQDVTLDDLYPGTQQQVNFSIQAPMSQQIQGEWSHNFHFTFSIASDGNSESNVGVITLTTRQGKILVLKSGFDQ